jgi:hypothetical protein
MILNEEKKLFRIREQIKKDGKEKKTIYVISSTEKLLDGKEYGSPAEAAMAILHFKNPLGFGRKDMNDKQKEADKLVKKILEKINAGE